MQDLLVLCLPSRGVIICQVTIILEIMQVILSLTKIYCRPLYLLHTLTTQDSLSFTVWMWAKSIFMCGEAQLSCIGGIQIIQLYPKSKE